MWSRTATMLLKWVTKKSETPNLKVHTLPESYMHGKIHWQTTDQHDMAMLQDWKERLRFLKHETKMKILRRKTMVKNTTSCEWHHTREKKNMRGKWWWWFWGIETDEEDW